MIKDKFKVLKEGKKARLLPPLFAREGLGVSFLSAIISLSIISCSVQSNLSEAVNSAGTNVYNLKVSDSTQAGEINVRINTSATGFKIKNNSGGTLPVDGTAVDHFVVYLVKNNTTTGYPAGGDPLVTDKVAGPFTVVNTGVVSVKFTGVNKLATGAYYVAVRAQNAGNTDLLRDFNGSATPWNASTNAISPKVAVSTGAGITVDTNYAVNTTVPLVVNANLPNGTGATLTAQTTFNEVNTTTRAKPLEYYISTIAGTGGGGFSGDGGQATAAGLNQPDGIVIDAAGNIYFCDFVNQKVRKIDVATGIITTIATGVNGFTHLAMDSANNIYVAEPFGHSIRKIAASTGIITTVAGTGTAGYVAAQDGGPATAAQIANPIGVTIDRFGNLYIGDSLNHRVRKVNTAGIITTIAGTGAAGYVAAQDGGPAAAAALNFPCGVTTDPAGNIYIADRNNNRIRKITVSTGIITTIAGGGASLGDNGPATSAQLNLPDDVALDAAGNLYIADRNNNRIRKVNTAGIITTIAGTGTASLTGDGGTALSATLNQPFGVGVDSSGNVYIGDNGNNRIRKLVGN